MPDALTFALSGHNTFMPKRSKKSSRAIKGQNNDQKRQFLIIKKRCKKRQKNDEKTIKKRRFYLKKRRKKRQKYDEKQSFLTLKRRLKQRKLMKTKKTTTKRRKRRQNDKKRILTKFCRFFVLVLRTGSAILGLPEQTSNFHKKFNQERKQFLEYIKLKKIFDRALVKGSSLVQN